MFCCFPLWRRSETPTHNDEKKPLTANELTKVRYQPIFTIPYAHVLRDDKIPLESMNVAETTIPSAYLLLNGMISDEYCETDCLSFDDGDDSTPIVLATTSTGHILVERRYEINHVTAVNPSTTTHTPPLPSSTVIMSRPFDEFCTDSTAPSNPPDVQSDDATTKSD